MKAKQFSFRVVIEQDEPEQKRNFGTRDGWAEVIRKRLESSLHVANVVLVEPIRNKARR